MNEIKTYLGQADLIFQLNDQEVYLALWELDFIINFQKAHKPNFPP